MIYLDAAYIAKFYVEEDDSERVRSFLDSASGATSCLHAMAEVASVFHRKLREGTVPQEDFDYICQQFESDCETGLWTWLPMPESLVQSARQKISKLPATVFLRAADALHLMCASAHDGTEIYTSDRHMIAAAPAFGLRPVTL
jgi:predicted nucleic acid-binding protein